MPAVHSENLVKKYGSLTAVDELDLDVPEGGCFGVLGPNGAGKTTTIRMITCVSPPTSGLLEVLGMDVAGDRRRIKQRLGVVPQGMTLDSDLTVRQNLTVHAAYFDIKGKPAQKRADELLEFTQLTDKSSAKVQHLSGGMQRRLLIARALINDPELIILDEPTTGLDPQARHLVWERLRNLRRQGKTLLITTHYMEEAAQLCDMIVVMDNGKIVAKGTPDSLIREHVPPRVVEVFGIERIAEEVRRAVASVTTDCDVVGDRLLAYGTDGEAIVGRLKDSGFSSQPTLLRDATLEDVFLRLTGHALVD